MLTMLLPLLPLVSLASALPRGCAAGTEPPAQSAATGKVLYLITNEDANAVVAIPIGADGTLSGGVLTETGGQGSVALGDDGQPAVPDALVSQSTVAMAGMNLFAVNAGSNSVSMLTISPNDPTSLTLINLSPVPGEFPNTVAASLENNLVCVATTGAVAGVSCAPFTDAGIGDFDELRPFDLGQTTPPVGPLNTVSQVFFSEAEDSLFVTVKGDPTVNNTGFLSVFPVMEDCSASSEAGEVQARNRQGRGRGRGNGRGNTQDPTTEADEATNMITVLSREPVNSSPDGTAVLFGSAVIPGTGSQIFATDASFGAAILSVSEQDDTASLVASQAIDGQAATCWVTISSLTGTAFVTDVGVNRVVEMSLQDASIVSMLDLSANGNPGLIDLRAAGGFVYALSPAGGEIEAAITVLDISGGAGTVNEVQNFGLNGLAGARSMGMVILE